MKTFNFNLDQKCTVWYRTALEIDAENLNSAKKMAIKFSKSLLAEELAWEIIEETTTPIPNEKELICVEDGVNLYETTHETQDVCNIEVNDSIELSPSVKLIEIQKAKKLLKDAGYYMDSIWSVSDIMFSFKCDESTAKKVLHEALSSESLFEDAWFHIKSEAKRLKLIPKTDDEKGYF